VDNNYLDLGMNKSGFVHTLPSGRLTDNKMRLQGVDPATSNVTACCAEQVKMNLVCV
jgi:hypothetical protein